MSRGRGSGGTGERWHPAAGTGTAGMTAQGTRRSSGTRGMSPEDPVPVGERRRERLLPSPALNGGDDVFRAGTGSRPWPRAHIQPSLRMLSEAAVLLGHAGHHGENERSRSEVTVGRREACTPQVRRSSFCCFFPSVLPTVSSPKVPRGRERNGHRAGWHWEWVS